MKEENLQEVDEKKEGNVVKDTLHIVFYFVLIVGLAMFIVTFVGQRTRVSGESMESNLMDGDNLIVEKISYRFHSPERFDIIVFPYHQNKKTYYIKRIIGLPKETIQITDGKIYINGEVLEENYGKEPMDLGSEGVAAEPVTLGEDEYFVMGDNRNCSSDSRDPSVGVIKRNEITGRAWMRIWPLNHIGMLKHQ